MKILHYFSIFACFFLLAITPIGFYQGFKVVNHANSTKSWDTVEGIITKSTIFKEEDGGTAYIPTIEYRYEINGKSYDHNQIISTERIQFGKLNLAKEYTDKYSENTKVTIYYNPVNPQDSVLETGVSVRHFFSLVMPSLVLIFGLFLVYKLFIKKKAKPNVDEDIKPEAELEPSTADET